VGGRGIEFPPAFYIYYRTCICYHRSIFRPSHVQCRSAQTVVFNALVVSKVSSLPAFAQWRREAFCRPGAKVRGAAPPTGNIHPYNYTYINDMSLKCTTQRVTSYDL